MPAPLLNIPAERSATQGRVHFFIPALKKAGLDMAKKGDARDAAGARLHVYYSGMVQGVGFRFTVQDLAARAGIGGWVRNLRDGTVEVLAEGGREGLEAFAAAIDAAMGGYVREARTEWSAPTGEFDSFQVRF